MTIQQRLKKSFCPARNNPFATEHLRKIRFRYTENSLRMLQDRFLALGSQAAIVGPQGHGKTTLQKELACAMESGQTHWIKLREGDRKIPGELLDDIFSRATPSDLFCIDGAEQLSWWNWKSFLRQLGKEHRCLITSHRKGLLPTLITCKTSVSLLSDIVRELTFPLSESRYRELELIFNKHRGDIRQSLRELYDRCSEGDWSSS